MVSQRIDHTHLDVVYPPRWTLARGKHTTIASKNQLNDLLDFFVTLSDCVPEGDTGLFVLRLAAASAIHSGELMHIYA